MKCNLLPWLGAFVLVIAGCTIIEDNERAPMASNSGGRKEPRFERHAEGIRITHYAEIEKLRQPWHSHWENDSKYADTAVDGFIGSSQIVVRADCAAYLWDLAGGVVKTKLSLDRRLVEADLDENTGLYAVLDVTSLSLWDLASKTRKWQLPRECLGTHVVAFSPDGQKLAHWFPPTGKSPSGIEILDAPTGSTTKLIELSKGNFQGFAFEWSPDGQSLLALNGTSTGDEVGSWATLSIFDANSGAKRLDLKMAAPPELAGFSSDGLQVFAASGLETMVWDGKEGKAILSTPKVLGAWRLLSDKGLPEPELICASYSIWGVKSHRSLREFKDQLDANQIFDLSVSPNSRWLSAATSKGLQVWDFVEGKTVLFDPDTRFVTSAKYSKDAAWIAYSGLNGAIRIRQLPK
ncbi:MAG: hypothetical protein BroJett014_27700 [Planctomycetota bacterium]|nr:MAG: hypothetical protein BroJett014_27700 [Planctomycetota bacterium]